MSDNLVMLICIGNKIGTVTTVSMYDDGYITVKGHTADGAKFDINYNPTKEEQKNDES